MVKRHAPKRAFVLLEVLVAVVIIAIAMVALIRGFVMSLNSLASVKETEKAMLLVQTVMDDLILELPAEGKRDGLFSKDPRFDPEEYADWGWEIEVEEEEPDYRERPRGKLGQDLEHMYIAQIRILKGVEERDPKVVMQVDTILLEPDIFSIKALQENQLF